MAEDWPDSGQRLSEPAPVGAAEADGPNASLDARASTRSFYHHFRSKSDILLENMREESEAPLDFYKTLDGEGRRGRIETRPGN